MLLTHKQCATKMVKAKCDIIGTFVSWELTAS